MMNNLQEQDQVQILEKLRKELRTTRIFCAISSVLTLLLLIGGCVAVVIAQDYAAEVTTVIQELAKLDVEELNLVMENVNAFLQSIDWEQVAVSLEALDVEAINAAIEKLDTEELTEALKNLNDASEKLREVGDKMASFALLFGK